MLPGAVRESVEMRRNVDTGGALAVSSGASPPVVLLSPGQREWARAAGVNSWMTPLLGELLVHRPLAIDRLLPVAASSGLCRAQLEYSTNDCVHPEARFPAVVHPTEAG